MAIFDFKCEKCEYIEEKFIHINDYNKIFKCDKCNSDMYKLLSAPKMFILKEGKGGFHKPGYNLK